MIILDTDCLSLFDREKYLENSVLHKNLGKFHQSEIYTSIITFEEQMRGWLAFLARCKSIHDQLYAYQRLHQFVKNFREIRVVDFDEKAYEVFELLKSQKIRVGTMDLKIASIAIANNAILVSRNLADFELVPGLNVNDWTR